MCIRAFDFVANGDSHVTKLQELNFSEGMLGATEDAIFYADTDAAGENETIYRMDKLTGESKAVCSGSRFVISPDGKLLAAETPNGLQIFDLANGDLVAQMEEAVTLSDFKFSHDSSRMFFVVDTEDSSTEYPGKFYMYDVEENEFSFLFATACIDFEWSLEANCVLVNFSYSTPSGYVPVTYRIRL